jgi:hypothetical protein
VSLSLVAIVPFLFTRRTRAGVVVGYAVLGQLLIFTTESSYEGSVLRVLFYLSLGLGIALVHAEGAPHGVDRPSTRATFGRPARAGDGGREIIDVRGIEAGRA